MKAEIAVLNFAIIIKNSAVESLLMTKIDVKHA